LPSVAAVTAEDAIYHAADKGNTIATASTVAIAVTIGVADVEPGDHGAEVSDRLPEETGSAEYGGADPGRQTDG